MVLFGTVDKSAQSMRPWLLQELRRAEDGNGAFQKIGSPTMLVWLKSARDLESEIVHCKFKTLVRGILNDWDVLGVFVKNSQDPPQSLRKNTSLRLSEGESTLGQVSLRAAVLMLSY